MADKIITNPAGAYGYDDLESQLWVDAAPFKASADIAAKTVVAIGTDGTVSTALTNAPGPTIGITLAAIGSGKTGLVAVAGGVENVPVNGAVVVGGPIKASATTAGYVAATATPAVGEALGIAIAASAANTVDVWLKPV